MNAEEGIVIKELRERNQRVFESTFKNYYHSLVRFAEGILFDPFMAEDEIQQLFVYIWENAEKLEIKTSLKGYLFQSARNRCLNRLKEINVYDKNKELYKEGVLNSQSLDHVEEEGLHKGLLETLSQLPAQQQKIARLKYVDGEKYAEIADLLNISINTVKTQLSRAKVSLRKLLTESQILLAALFSIFC